MQLAAIPNDCQTQFHTWPHGASAADRCKPWTLERELLCSSLAGTERRRLLAVCVPSSAYDTKQCCCATFWQGKQLCRDQSACAGCGTLGHSRLHKHFRLRGQSCRWRHPEMAAACSQQPMATLSPSGMATILTRWMLPLALLCWVLAGQHQPSGRAAADCPAVYLSFWDSISRLH